LPDNASSNDKILFEGRRIAAMRNSLWKLLSATVLTTGVLILIAPPAQAQGGCVPLSGMVYGYSTPTDAGWNLKGNLTIDREVHRYTAVTVGTSGPIPDPFRDVWRGTETWTLNFGRGNTLQVMTAFVTEHANLADPNSTGVFHVTELGKFANGTGMFRHVYGSLFQDAPFGPNVELTDIFPQLPEGTWFVVGPVQGTMCGLDDRDER
jgi:hypothetical protein